MFMENKIPPQHQASQRGIEGQMTPEPKYIRFNYKG